MSNPTKPNPAKASKFAGLISAAGIGTQHNHQPERASAPAVASRAATAERGTPKMPAVGRRSNPDYVQISAYINRRLYRNVQKALLDQDNREVSQLLEELLTEWMANGCPEPGPAKS